MNRSHFSARSLAARMRGDEVAVEVTITDGEDGFEAVVPPQQF
jgi:hypothetical protein